MPEQNTPQQPASGSTSLFKAAYNAARKLVVDTVKLCLDLYKIMIPVIILIKILETFDLIRYAAWPLSPVMHLVGLPVEMGLVWAFAIISNLYSGLIVYAAIAPTMDPLSTAQITVLATMMLVAHNILVECRITKLAGLSFLGQAVIRIVFGALFGLALHGIFSGFDLLEGPSVMLFTPAPRVEAILPWALGEARNLAMIFVIILCLLALMRVLNKLRITDLFVFLLTPVLKLLGIGKSAATVTIIGLTLGLTYGGGLIVHEVRMGNVDRRDVFPSLTLMGMSHALIEDTLLMALLGAHMLGTFWLRLALSLVAVAIMIRVMKLWARRKTADAVAAPAGAQAEPEAVTGNRE